MSQRAGRIRHGDSHVAYSISVRSERWFVWEREKRRRREQSRKVTATRFSTRINVFRLPPEWGTPREINFPLSRRFIFRGSAPDLSLAHTLDLVDCCSRSHRAAKLATI